MSLVYGYATALLFYENSDHLIFIVIFRPSYTKNECMATSPFPLLEGVIIYKLLFCSDIS